MGNRLPLIICEDTRGTNASCSAFNMSFRTFSAADAKGGTEVVLSKTAILFIEYQNEFTSEGGKLHNAVKPCMDETGMLEKSSALASKARDSGVNIFHAVCATLPKTLSIVWLIPFHLYASPSCSRMTQATTPIRH